MYERKRECDERSGCKKLSLNSIVGLLEPIPNDFGRKADYIKRQTAIHTHIHTVTFWELHQCCLYGGQAGDHHIVSDSLIQQQDCINVFSQQDSEVANTSASQLRGAAHFLCEVCLFFPYLCGIFPGKVV